MVAKVNIDLNLETDKAISSVRKFSSSATKSLSSISSSLTSIGVLAGGAVAALAGAKFIGVLKEAAAAATIQEDAIKKMNTALAISGEFSEEASRDMQDFASSIQAVTTAGDEAVLEQIALAKSMGATNEQAKELVKGAVDLSASMGISLETATRQLSKTLGGVAGRMADVLPELRGMTAEQLKSGAAIDLVRNKFDGAAASITQTYGGALIQSQNLMGDLQEEIGFLITKNELVTKGVGLFSKTIESAIKIISENRSAIIAFVNKGIKLMISMIPKALKAIRFMSDSIQGIALVSSTARLAIAELMLGILSFDLGKKIVNGLADVFKALGITVLSVVSGILEALSAIPGASSLMNAVGLDVNSLTEKIDNAGASLVDSFGSDVTDELKTSMTSLRDSAMSDAEDIEEGFRGINTGIDTVIEGTEKLVDGILEIGDAQVESSNKAIEALNKQAKAGGAGGTTGTDKAAAAKAKAEEKRIDGIVKGAAVAAIGAIKQGGKEGAEALVSTIGGAVGNAFGIPGVGELLNLLMTDGAASLVTGVIASLPEVIEKLAENMPQVAIALVTALGNPLLYVRIANSVIDGFTKGLDASFKDMQRQWTEFVDVGFADIRNEISGVGVAIRETLFNFWLNFKAGFLTVWDEISQAIKAPFIAIEELFNNIFGAIQTLWDNISGSKVGGAVSKAGTDVKDFLGFSEGGIVPSGFNNDNFPARLTSGEAVIKRDTTEALGDFLNRQGAVEALLAQLVAASTTPMVINTSVELDGNAFAEIQLEGYRRGVRTA